MAGVGADVAVRVLGPFLRLRLGLRQPHVPRHEVLLKGGGGREGRGRRCEGVALPSKPDDSKLVWLHQEVTRKWPGLGRGERWWGGR